MTWGTALSPGSGLSPVTAAAAEGGFSRFEQQERGREEAGFTEHSAQKRPWVYIKS